MGPSPSWTPLLNLRLVAHYLSLCTGYPHIQIRTKGEDNSWILDQLDLGELDTWLVDQQQAAKKLLCNYSETFSQMI